MKTRIVKRNESGKKWNGLLVLGMAVSLAISPVPVWAANDRTSTNPGGTAIAVKPVVQPKGTTRAPAPVQRVQAPAPLVNTRDMEDTTALPHASLEDAVRKLASATVQYNGVKILNSTSLGTVSLKNNEGEFETYEKLEVLYATSLMIPAAGTSPVMYQARVFSVKIYQSTEDDSYGNVSEVYRALGVATSPSDLSKGAVQHISIGSSTSKIQKQAAAGLISVKEGVPMDDVTVTKITNTNPSQFVELGRKYTITFELASDPNVKRTTEVKAYPEYGFLERWFYFKAGKVKIPQHFGWLHTGWWSLIPAKTYGYRDVIPEAITTGSDSYPSNVVRIYIPGKPKWTVSWMDYNVLSVPDLTTL